ncbi:hypothetical protein GCM10007049_26430 [Echinicola pacifica]|uniref:DoxX-like family protein n=1 Tax=Echinicola pacifica TaxID=346377 RepID=A0A918Q5M6_9BACT|nr:DoxX family protein [Echinicola pacifica]GGZ31789.1 hypothetical protein GCM10007049_26430 [Echinicola pacifica]
MKNLKTIFLVSTALLSLLLLMSAGIELFTAGARDTFVALGYPAYLSIPLGLAKIAGLIAFWLVKNPTIKEWAYAGFFFDFVLAASAHLISGFGNPMIAIIALVLLAISYISRMKAGLN